jgi:hypothetical protein
MLKKAALEFGRGVAGLGMLEVNCINFRKLDSSVLIERADLITQTTRNIIENLRRICIEADLDDVRPELDRFDAMLNRGATIDEIAASAGHLKHRIIDELENEHYYQVARVDVQYYGQKELFGPSVARKFKDAAYDIENAGNCLALGQGTACVFHLARAMDVALSRLARKLKITVGAKDSWGVILGAMSGKINKMPEASQAKKNKRDKWSEARIHLFHVKEAWRDRPLHAKQTYSPARAKEILEAVKVFMAYFATL